MKKIKELYSKYEELINYLFIGGCTTLISLFVYYLCVFTIFNPENSILLQCANVLSWIIAVAFAYIANRKFVFKSQNENVKNEVSKFLSARIVTLLIDMIFMWLTVSVLHFNDKIMKILSNIIIIVLNYIFSKLYVFVKENKQNGKK